MLAERVTLPDVFIVCSEYSLPVELQFTKYLRMVLYLCDSGGWNQVRVAAVELVTIT